jgi:hypothetical protein
MAIAAVFIFILNDLQKVSCAQPHPSRRRAKLSGSRQEQRLYT